MAVAFTSAVQNMQDGKTQMVMRTIYQTAPVTNWLKVKPIRGLTLQRSIDQEVPEPSYIGINQTIVDADFLQGSTRLAKDTVARLAAPIKIDIDMGELPSDFESEKRKQTRLVAEGVALKFCNDFFLGMGGRATGFVDPIGIYRRMLDDINAGTMPSDQLINCGGPLTLDKMDELLAAVPGRPGTTRVLFMNRKNLRDLNALLRDPSYRGMYMIQEGKGEFGTIITTYGQVKIAVIERYDNYYSPLSGTESGTDSTVMPTSSATVNGYSSIWLVGFGDEEMVYGFSQGSIPSSTDAKMGPGTLGFTLEPFVRVPDQYYEVSMSRWLFGFACDGPRWGARLWGIAP